MELKFKVQAKIQKPVAEVFDGVYNPTKLSTYFTTGGGFYQEELGTHSDTGFGVNTGAGVKVSLAGPIRLRVDYRLFKLGALLAQALNYKFQSGFRTTKRRSFK